MDASHIKSMIVGGILGFSLFAFLAVAFIDIMEAISNRSRKFFLINAKWILILIAILFLISVSIILSRFYIPEL